MTNNFRVVTSKILMMLVAANAVLADTPAPTLAVPATAPPSAKATPATPAPAEAQENVDGTFSKEQLEQIVAPIALYPDALLTQMLMAATYPIEVVQADRFMRANPGLKDTALETKLKEQEWDTSVKGLCSLPDVLKKMSENLDWTQDLGDAFLGQKEEVLDTVQRMRGKANDAGNLKTTEQQVITVQQDKIILIESKSPEVVYVPTYSPTVVYGAGWGYPYWYYPYWYRPVPYGYGLVTFGVGIAVGAAIWGGCRWGWGRGNINVNINRYNNFNGRNQVNPNRGGSVGANGSFNHNASHRGGVGYQNSKVAGQYGAKAGTNRASTSQARGRSGSGASAGTQGRGGGAGQGASARSGSAGSGASARSGSAGSGASSRAGATSSGAGSRSSGGYNGGGSTGRSSGSYGGSSGSYGSYGGSRGSSSSSYRGSSSRGTSSYGGGGGYRGGGGGGMRGGGGGRRR